MKLFIRPLMLSFAVALLSTGWAPSAEASSNPPGVSRSEQARERAAERRRRRQQRRRRLQALRQRRQQLRAQRRNSNPRAVPELDPSATGQAGVLLLGGALLLMNRRKKSL